MSTMPEQQQSPSAITLRRAHAFGRGCDARLAGLPQASCPYPDGDYLAQAWLYGWRDVDVFYGREALWPFRDLPEVLFQQGEIR